MSDPNQIFDKNNGNIDAPNVFQGAIKEDLVEVSSYVYEQVGATLNHDASMDVNIAQKIKNNPSENMYQDSSVSLPVTPFGDDVKPFDNQSFDDTLDTSSVSDSFYNNRIVSEEEPIMQNYSETDIVNNYNHINDTYTEDDSYFKSVEDQLTSSKDIPLYTQHPKAPVNFDEQVQNLPKSEPTNSSMQPVNNPSVVNFVPVTSEPILKEQPKGYIPKSPFASKPNQTGKTNFDKKVEKSIKPFKVILYLLYAIVACVLIFVGYKFYVRTNDFYLGKSELNLAIGSSYKETVYRKGYLDNNSNYRWVSLNENIVKVDSNGKLVGVNPGSTTIEVKSRDTKTSKRIAVNVVNITVNKIKTDVVEKVIYMGNTFTITPIVNNQADITLDLEWYSNDSTIAKVNNYGLVTPVKPGRTTITVRVPNTQYSADVDIIVAEKK